MMNEIFNYTNDANIELLMKKHPISDIDTREILINYMICKHYKKIYYSILNFTKDIELTKDILQETFFHTSRRFNNIRSLSSYKAYNIRTAMNIAKKILPQERNINESSMSIYKENGRINDELMTPPVSNDPYYITEFKEVKHCIEGFLDKLGSPDREIIIRKYIYLESYESIVESLGINNRTARKRSQRARKKLKAMVNKHFHTDG